MDFLNTVIESRGMWRQNMYTNAAFSYFQFLYGQCLAISGFSQSFFFLFFSWYQIFVFNFSMFFVSLLQNYLTLHFFNISFAGWFLDCVALTVMNFLVFILSRSVCLKLFCPFRCYTSSFFFSSPFCIFCSFLFFSFLLDLSCFSFCKIYISTNVLALLDVLNRVFYSRWCTIIKLLPSVSSNTGTLVFIHLLPISSGWTMCSAWKTNQQWRQWPLAAHPGILQQCV